MWDVCAPDAWTESGGIGEDIMRKMAVSLQLQLRVCDDL